MGDQPAELAKALRFLTKNLRRLKDGQGRIARRNAREAALASLRWVRSSMDCYFPPITGERRPRASKAHLSAAQLYANFKRKMARRGYEAVPSIARALAISQGGVRLVHPPKRTGVTVAYAPRWAVQAAGYPAPSAVGMAVTFNVAKVSEARRSTTLRKALLAAHALGAGSVAV